MMYLLGAGVGNLFNTRAILKNAMFTGGAALQVKLQIVTGTSYKNKIVTAL